MIKVLKKEKIAGKEYLFEFDKKINYSPGQFISIKVGKSAKPFSIISKNGENLQIATLDTGSEYKKALFSASKIEIGEPMGVFKVREGVFIAGGIGVTPFISALRNGINGRLIYSVKTLERAAFLEELKEMEELDLFLRVTSEEGRVDEAFLKECVDLDEPVYVIGSNGFVEGIIKLLKEIGVTKIKQESFPGY